VVAETNDGFLNDIRARPIAEADVLRAIREAREGPVAEGSVGAGRGTVAFGWKGGIGTASRRLPARLGGWTVGVLVQTNFGGVLAMGGAPVGQELGQFYLRGQVSRTTDNGERSSPDGSVIIVVATDAPLDHRQLTRLATRALAGLARTGSSMSNGSGDYVVAFSSRRTVGRPDRRTEAQPSVRPPVRLSDTVEVVTNDAMSPVFEAAIEATEEAIYNSLLRAESVHGYRGTVSALPLDSTLAILKRHGVIHP
jgi:D-aminopeptidase